MRTTDEAKKNTRKQVGDRAITGCILRLLYVAPLLHLCDACQWPWSHLHPLRSCHCHRATKRHWHWAWRPWRAWRPWQAHLTLPVGCCLQMEKPVAHTGHTNTRDDRPPDIPGRGRTGHWHWHGGHRRGRRRQATARRPATSTQRVQERREIWTSKKQIA